MNKNASGPFTWSLVALQLQADGFDALMPVLAQAARYPVKAYLFVDAGLPHPDKTRLKEMEATVPAFAQELRRLLAEDSRFPNWKSE
jgi:hypothetical protein